MSGPFIAHLNRQQKKSSMSVLLIVGSPSERSRSSSLLDAVADRLHASGLSVDRLVIRDLPPKALLLADTSQRSIQQAVDAVATATAVVVATPVYKAAYSGVLKVFLDLLPQSALAGKVVLPLATGGSPNHMLALDYALRPVLQSLAARHILPGVYVSDSQFSQGPDGAYHLTLDMQLRLEGAVATLCAESFRQQATTGFEPVPFSRVRCSV